MNLVVHPSSITCHDSRGYGYQKLTFCGVSCSTWPTPRELRPLRFCARCFSPRERELLTAVLPENTQSPLQWKDADTPGSTL